MASIIRKTLGVIASCSVALKSKTAALIGRGDDFNAKSVGCRLKRNAGVVVNGCLASGTLPRFGVTVSRLRIFACLQLVVRSRPTERKLEPAASRPLIREDPVSGIPLAWSQWR